MWLYEKVKIDVKKGNIRLDEFVFWTIHNIE